jgi:hypothetical protein
MAQIQSDIRLHVDSAVQNLIPRLEARLGSNIARLSSARLVADDVAGGSHYADVSDDWTLTCHADWHDDVTLTS